jgi:MFS family permease
VDLADGDGAVEGHDRRRGDGKQLVVQGDDLGPVGLRDGPSIGVDGVDGRLELIGTGLVAAKAAAEDRLAFLDQGLIPAGAVLLAEQHQGTVGPGPRRAPGFVEEQQASRPATSGSSGRSEARIRATQLAFGLYVAYNLAATVASLPAGRLGDRRGAVLVLAFGVGLFGLAYGGFAAGGSSVPALAPWFVAAGVGIGCVETAEHAAVATLAPVELRGSAFGLLAAVQSFGNLAASAVAGLLWTLASPRVAFGYLVAWMVLALVGLLLARPSTA